MARTRRAPRAIALPCAGSTILIPSTYEATLPVFIDCDACCDGGREPGVGVAGFVICARVRAPVFGAAPGAGVPTMTAGDCAFTGGVLCIWRPTVLPCDDSADAGALPIVCRIRDAVTPIARNASEARGCRPNWGPSITGWTATTLT